MSERSACQLVNQPRGTQRYRPTQRDDEDALTRAIITLASQYGRYGYRGITAELHKAGWRVVRTGSPRRAEGSSEAEAARTVVAERWISCVRLRPGRRNHVWSYDFVSTFTHDGRTVRMLNLIDEFTREFLARTAHAMPSCAPFEEIEKVDRETRK
jgi:transposase InsO family protein